MKIVAGIIVLLLVIGIILGTQFFGKPKGEQPKKETAAKQSQEVKKETGFFDQLFGATSTETKKSSGTGFFDQIFGGAGGGKTTPSTGGGGQGGFFDQIFGGGETQSGQPSPEKGSFFENIFGGDETGASSTTSAPKISSGLPTGDLPVETRKVTLSLKTDKIAICKYSSGSGLSYDAMQNVFSQTNAISHSTEVTGFNENTAYKYYIKCASRFGIKNTEDYVISFKILAPKDTTPPERRNLEPSWNLPAGATETQINVNTNEPAYCRYSALPPKDYNSMASSFSPNETKTFHKATVKGLKNGQAYEYFVRCQDLAGNKNTGDVLISFQVNP